MKINTPKIPSITLTESQFTKNSIFDLNKSIVEQLKIIENINFDEIDETMKETINEILIATDVLINDCHQDPRFQENKNSNIIKLIYEYHKLSIKLETYNLEKKVSEVESKVISVNDRAEKIEESQKGILTNIISIILAVAIIPTAITAIEKIHPNYVLAFISTFVMFAMILIIFTYYSHNSKPSNLSIAITILIIAITIILWGLSWKLDISLKPKNNPIIQTQVTQ